MRGATHLGAGAVLGIALSSYCVLPPEEAIVTTVCSMVGSLAPDLDSETSIVGRVFFPVAWVSRHLFGHRTFFHALLPWSVMAGIAWIAFPGYTHYLLASALGVVSHLALDLLNHTGIPLLWPMTTKFSLGLCRSGGMIDKLLGKIFPALSGLLLIGYLIRLGT